MKAEEIRITTDSVAVPMSFPTTSNTNNNSNNNRSCSASPDYSHLLLAASPMEEEEFAYTSMAQTPSSKFEAAICSQLKELVANVQASWESSTNAWKILLQNTLFEENGAVFVTSVMLIISCFLYPTAETVLCTCVFMIVYAFSTALQGYLVWSRLTETKYRTASVIHEATDRWQSRIESMPAQRSLTDRERRDVFVESFAQLPTKAFRMVAVVDDRTYRLKHIQKCLMFKGTKRLDEATMKVRKYMEPKSTCKLVDIMRLTLEEDAIVLKPLADKAKPPRLPNLLISSKKFVEDEDTTDESDGERDSRTVLGGGNTISVSHHMEHFSQRVMLLMWIVAMVLTVGAGFLFYYLVKAPLGEGVFLDPSVALLGLLPVNAILLNRILVFYANVYLDKLFHHLVSKATHSPDDRLPRFSFWATLRTMLRILLRQQPANGGRNPLVFSTSMVDAFGMASVIAMLDQTGIVTDMVLLPTQILMLRLNAHPSSSSSDDDEDIVGCLTERSKLDAAERRREMKKQIKRKKFQEERFLELQLQKSAKEDLAVEFTNEKELARYQSHVHPICLCILLHAMAAESSNLETWTEPFRFCDRTLRWCRAMHWIPRACGFQDSVASAFVVIARIFQINTNVKTGYRNRSPDQSCSLLVEGADGMLHLFTIGTPFMVSQHCTTHWTGTTVDEFNKDEKKEIVFMAKQQWEEGMCLETVALSHRVLPERYRTYVDGLGRCSTTVTPTSSGAAAASPYREFFFRNGEEVSSHTWNQRKQRRRQAAAAAEGAEEDDADDDVYPVACPDPRPSHSSSAPVSPLLPTKTRAAAVAAAMPPRRASFGDKPSEKKGALEDDDCLTTKTFIKLMATTSHTFLGLVGLRDSVRPNVQASMSMLEDAGVRCMYFCPGTEREARSFGSRVGLETDWNCCISLKEDAVALDPHSIRAQLPFGIKSIRKHILHVDPIPLQVNLFSHATGVATRAMLSILQDNHEVVVAVGSVFNHSNVRALVQADLAVGVLPTRRGPNANKEQVLRHGRIVEPSDFAPVNTLNRDLPLYRNVAELIGCSCSLRAPPTTSILPIITTMVRQARLRLSGIGNCVEFVMHANFLIVLLNAVSLIAGGPLLIGPTVTVFELNVIVPILALSCTYTAYSGMDIMKTMSSRHNHFVRLAIFRHSAIVWCLRYMPSLIALLILGLTASVRMCNVGVLQLINRTTDQCMDASRGYVALTLNYWLMVHGWTHMSRHHPISLSFSLRLGHGRRSTYLFQSYRWLAASVVVTFLSVMLVVMVTPFSIIDKAFYPSTVHFVFSFIFPILLLGLDWPIKQWREKRFHNMQKFRKLTFGTRLGMHSPRGDYEPEGITYNNNSTSEGEDADAAEGTKRPVSVGKKIHEAFYRYATMRGGKLELNCVCCDHIGGNYASYHVTSHV